MEIILIILLIVILFPLLAALGWLMKGLGELLSLMWEGVENLFGCGFQIFFWIFVIIVIIAMLL